MQYSDRIYGSFDITSPVLIELIESPSMQRLKKIDQSGYSAPFYPNTFHSRFEHSMGVLYLLQRYNAPLEEQIAGLLHDVSHSAFSHTIDFLIGSEEKQNYQDDIFKEFIHRTEIPAILQKHQIPIDYILHEKNFPLQETPLPSLCADRIDYSLRSAIMFREITLTDIELILNKLQVHDQKWVFANKEIAFSYAYLFSFLNNTYYSSLTSAIMFQTTKDFLHYSLEKKYIVFQDLYTSDEEVLNTILPHLGKDTQLQLFYERMNNKIPIVNNPDQYDVKITCKSRVVDPLCLHQGKVYFLSDLYPEWNGVVKIEKQPKTYFLQFAK